MILTALHPPSYFFDLFLLNDDYSDNLFKSANIPIDMNWKSARRRMKECTVNDYLKAVYINKYTLTGYASAVACLGMAFAVDWKEIDTPQLLVYGLVEALTGLYSVLTLSQTALGIPTMITYNRAKHDLQRYGYLKRSFNRLYDSYCDEAAIDYALKESKSDRKLKPADKPMLEKIVNSSG